MNRRDFFGFFGAALAAMLLGRKQDTSNDWTREILEPHHPPLADPGHRHFWHGKPSHAGELFDPWHGNWPIMPPHYVRTSPQTVSWHNTGINRWPNKS